MRAGLVRIPARNAIRAVSGTAADRGRVANVLPLSPAPIKRQAGPVAPAVDPLGSVESPAPRRFGETQ
jgi:hypothetical protein